MTTEQISDEMYNMVADAQSMGKKLKPMDLTKAVVKQHEDVDKKQAKAAIKELVDNGRLVYSYFGGTFLELPRKEGAAND